MNILVKKPTETEKNEMESHPIWECDISEFDWHFDLNEICLIVEGQATVCYDGGSVSFGAGDYVVFPKDLSCVWKVSKPIKKHFYKY